MTPSSPKSNSESVALYVTTTADENNGDQSGTGLSLRDAILEINSNPGQAYNVCLESGSIYRLTIQEDSSQRLATGDLDVVSKSTVTIKAIGGNENAIIDATDLGSRVFHVIDAELTLENITITGANLQNPLLNGGAILIQDNGKVNLIHSRLEGNTVKGSGAGVYISSGILDIRDSTIINNEAGNTGAGIAAVEKPFKDVKISLERTIVSNNRVANGKGAGIYALEGVELDIRECTFENNSSNEGSSCYARGENIDRSSIRIYDSIFRFNESHDGAGGGAISIDKSTLKIWNTSFENNRTIVTDSTYQPFGGALLADEFSAVNINGSSFKENHSDGTGGAVAIGNRSSATFIDIEFHNNSAALRAGGLYFHGDDNVLQNILFQKNESPRAAGALLAGSKNTASRVSFISNISQEVGSAALLSSDSSTWTETKVLGNRTNFSERGIVSVLGGVHSFESLTATENLGSVLGVFPDENEVSLNITGGQLNNNTSQHGAAIHADAEGLPAEIEIRNTVADKNRAYGEGGVACFIDRVSVTIENCHFFANRANVAGTIAIQGATLDVKSTDILSSSAFYSGSIRTDTGKNHPQRGQLRLISSVIRNSSSDTAAGAISVGAGSDVHVDNSLIDCSRARTTGTAIELQTSQELIPAPALTIRNSSILRSLGLTGSVDEEKSAIFVVYGSEGEPALGSLPKFPGELSVYNTLIDETMSKNEERIPDFAGERPLNAKNNAIGLIVDPTGFDESNLLNTSFGITFYSDGYIINSSSPLINSGNNIFLPDNIDFDIVGNTRVFGEIVDIGALEYPGFDQEPPSSDDFPPPPS